MSESFAPRFPSSILTPPIQSDATGVGISNPLTATSVSVVPLCRPLVVEYAAAPDALQSVVVVVGRRPRDANATSDGRSGPTRPAASPLFEPYCDALGVGSEAEEALPE